MSLPAYLEAASLLGSAVDSASPIPSHVVGPVAHQRPPLAEETAPSVGRLDLVGDFVPLLDVFSLLMAGWA